MENFSTSRINLSLKLFTKPLTAKQSNKCKKIYNSKRLIKCIDRIKCQPKRATRFDLI